VFYVLAIRVIRTGSRRPVCMSFDIILSYLWSGWLKAGHGWIGRGRAGAVIWSAASGVRPVWGVYIHFCPFKRASAFFSPIPAWPALGHGFGSARCPSVQSASWDVQTGTAWFSL